MPMEIPLSEEDKRRIEAGIREKYARVAITPEGLFKYPSGRAGLEALHYDPDILRTLPPKALDSFCGVGNPFSLGPIAEGESVLDLGSGGGVDSMVAASLVGPSGKVVGLDFSPEMVARARENLQETEFTQVEFRDFSGEKLPFPDERLDVVISNGVFNLIPDKAGMLKEVFRVLKTGGRLMIADQVLTGGLPPDLKSRVESWSLWQGGAIPERDFLALLKEAGFHVAESAGETGFNSSPVTKGALFRAVKKTLSRGISMEEGLKKYREFFEAAYSDGAIDRKTKHLIALGASLGAGCEPWTAYCLAVARDLGASEEELKETMAVAMTVGATKIQLLQQRASGSLPHPQPSGSPTQPELKPLHTLPSSGFTWATRTGSGTEPKSE